MKKVGKWIVVVLGLLLLCVVGYGFACIYVLSGASDHIDVHESFKTYYDKRNELVDLVKTYQLEYDENGYLIDLNKVGFGGLANNDKVRLWYYEEEKIILEFVINPGFPDEGQSLFYSTGGEDLLKEKLPKNDIGYIKKLENNWYKLQWK